MTRQQILSAIHNRLEDEYPERADVIMASISDQLDEWDATPPYPEESEFQALLSEQVYPLLAMMHSLRG